MIMRLNTPHIEVMFCTRESCTEVVTHHPAILDMDSSQDGSIEVSI